jgi:alkanesulfonate monooxygenase SsuD/methylene tetrahydromethanopterin reductase-like flavin-dependent oxidoreductase (luciferase family)
MAPLAPLPLPIGVRIAPTPALSRPPAVQMAAQAAEALGYAAVWVVGDDAEELVTLATLAAQATDTIRVGIGLLVGEDGLRTSQRLALPRLRRIAPGRLTLGLAVAQDLDAAVAGHVLDTVRSGADSGEPPRLVLSARSPDGVDLVARRADGWLADGVAVAELPARWAAVRHLAASHERAGAVALVVPAWVDLMDETVAEGRADYQGDVAQVAGDVLRAAAAGAEEVVLMPTGKPTLDELLDMCARVGEALEELLADGALVSRPG